jgi:DNA ligase (NAD+)
LPKPRKDVEELIEKNGGHPSSALSAKTDFLIIGEEPGSKLQKAKTLDVKVITYPELLKLIEERSGHPRLF